MSPLRFIALLFTLGKLLVQWQRLLGLVQLREGYFCCGFIVFSRAGEYSKISVMNNHSFHSHHHWSCNSDCPWRPIECKGQYCIGIWNVRSMNQGNLEVVKQEMARGNIDILGVSELKWTGLGEFYSDDHYI